MQKCRATLLLCHNKNSVTSGFLKKKVFCLHQLEGFKSVAYQIVHVCYILCMEETQLSGNLTSTVNLCCKQIYSMKLFCDCWRTVAKQGSDTPSKSPSSTNPILWFSTTEMQSDDPEPMTFQVSFLLHTHTELSHPANQDDSLMMWAGTHLILIILHLPYFGDRYLCKIQICYNEMY